MRRTIVNPVIKDSVTFMQTARESARKLTEIEIRLLPGGGNTLHYHKTYSETFTAVDGDLGVRIGKNERRILKPGQSHTVKPMQVHSFYNPGSSAIKFNVKIEPGHEGFENTLRILYGLAADGLTNEKSIPKSLTHTAVVITMSDMNVPGLLTFMSPVLKWLAGRAAANGTEQQLISKYCS
jgi:quercetin dioxygenase-like cupin family protein